jgi:hypothetical protein
MTRRQRQIKCGDREARERLRIARANLETADAAYNDKKVDEYLNVAVGLAVTAGIAAADSICCRRLGTQSKGPNHHDAADLLRGATADGTKLATALAQLLDLKNDAQYGSSVVAPSKGRRALRNAAMLVQRAQEELER